MPTRRALALLLTGLALPTLALAQSGDADPGALDEALPGSIDDELPTYDPDQERLDGRDPGPRVVHPITAFNYADDALITSDMRGSYLHQHFPRNANVPSGGAARVYDFQLRHAVDDRFQLLVSKLGAADVHLGGEEEFDATDVALGFKYAVLNDVEGRQHVALGATYEFGIGDEDTLGDDDEVRLFGAWTRGFGRFNVTTSANLAFATGDESANGDSDRLFLHAHLDYELDELLSPVVELSYVKVIEESSDPARVSAVNPGALASFGGNGDEDVLTLGLGGELRLNRDLRLRLAYESPLSDDEDLFGYRWTASAVWTL